MKFPSLIYSPGHPLHTLGQEVQPTILARFENFWREYQQKKGVPTGHQTCPQNPQGYPPCQNWGPSIPGGESPSSDRTFGEKHPCQHVIYPLGSAPSCRCGLLKPKNQRKRHDDDDDQQILSKCVIDKDRDWPSWIRDCPMW